MIKYLPLFLLLLWFLPAAAQTTADSLNKHNHADTIKSNVPPDSVARKQLMESVKDMPADSVLHQQQVEFLKKQTADSLAKINQLKAADSLAKKLAADSLLRQAHSDSVKKVPIDTATKMLQPVKTAERDSILKKDSTVKIVVPTVPEKKARPDSAGHLTKTKAAIQPPAANPALKHSPIKTIDDKKYNGLLNGDDMDDMSLAGEINHYPLPDKALKYKAQLQLNPGQITKLKDIVANLNRKKKEMGGSIIRNERTLDSLFRTHEVDEGNLIFYTNRYGLYQGELRNAILQACLKTRDILSEVQIRKLESLESK
jgi:hypothetical protein